MGPAGPGVATTMQAREFIRKWQAGSPAHALNERAGAQYNQRPAWLAQAHRTLDAAVAAAYGWADYTPAMPDDEVLRRLLALNLQGTAA